MSTLIEKKKLKSPEYVLDILVYTFTVLNSSSSRVSLKYIVNAVFIPG